MEFNNVISENIIQLRELVNRKNYAKYEEDYAKIILAIKDLLRIEHGIILAEQRDCDKINHYEDVFSKIEIILNNFKQH